MHNPSRRFNVQLFISISCIRESLIIISGASKIQVHALMHLPPPPPPPPHHHLCSPARMCACARTHTPIAEPLPTPQGGRAYRSVALPIRIVVITCNRRNYKVKPAFIRCFNLFVWYNALRELRLPGPHAPEMCCIA